MEVKITFNLLGGRTVVAQVSANRYFDILDRHLSVRERRRWERELNPFEDRPIVERGSYVNLIWIALCRAGEAAVPATEEGTLLEYPHRCHFEILDETRSRGRSQCHCL